MKVIEKKLNNGKYHLDCTATVEEVAIAFQESYIAWAAANGLRPDGEKTIPVLAREQAGISDLETIVANDCVEELICFAIDKQSLCPAFMPTANYNNAPKMGREFKFSIDVTPKPEYELSSYEPVVISVPEFQLNPQILDSQMEDFKEYIKTSSIEYVTVDPRPIHADHDNCLIALETRRNGEPFETLTRTKYGYLTGEGYMPEEFEKELIGMQPGETKTIAYKMPAFGDDQLESDVTVLEIQEKIVPELNDEWVAKNMPWCVNVEGLREFIKQPLVERAREEYNAYCMSQAASEMANRFSGNKIPDEIYEMARVDIMQQQQQQLAMYNMQAQQNGGKAMTWDEYVNAQGGQQQFGMMLMLQTRQMLWMKYAMDAVYRHEKLQVTDADYEAVCKAMNPNMKPAELRKKMEVTGKNFVLREAAERHCANRYVLAQATVNTVD